ncbi:AMP-binding protein [Nocardiopsis sp. CNT-189]|uniref:AMP-binding protein n=1 Tax=Nocardiopsis oceanisediminis TaxID=2816862 RepID=UPI003B302162
MGPRTAGGPELYRAEGWWRAELLDDLVLRHASDGAAGADRPAVAGPRPLTHRGLAAAVDSAAGRLAGLGVRAPGPVLVQLPNGPELLVLTLALIRAGCPPILAHPALREHELEPVVADLAPVAAAVPAATGRTDHPAMLRGLLRDRPGPGAVLVLGPGERRPGEADLAALCAPGRAPGRRPHTARPGDTALYFLSSGTTGPPKPIPRTHEALGSVLRAAAGAAGLGPDSVYLAALPATHSFTCAHPGMLGALARGGSVAFAGTADTDALLELAERHRATHTALVPTLAEQLASRAAASGAAPRSLRAVQVGGARLAPETARRIRAELGCRVQQVYGMSEGLLTFTRLGDPEDVTDLTQGRPVAPGDELLVVGADGRPAAPGEQGELWTRGPSTITAYAGRAAGEPGRFGPEGHYRTGDLVRLDAAGNVSVTGRVKDVINRGGEKIAADDLESVLTRHPGVRAAAAVGFPHPLYGEGVCAVVVPGGDPPDGAAPLTLRGLRAFLSGEGVAAFKLPDRVVLLDALPAIGIGKVDKEALRRLAADRTAGPARTG